MRTSITLSLFLTTTFALAGCGDDGGAGDDLGGDDDGAPTIDAGDPNADPQLPPEGATALQAWIAAGYYQSWNCEAAGHDARPPSPHGRNRICNNAAIENTASGPFPIGAASVKELLDDSDQVIGHAVYRKLATGTDGSNWYWYEEMNGSVVADGDGSSGVPKTVCVDCHSHAERDFVFTIVP